MFEIARLACTCMLAITSSANLHVHTMIGSLFDSRLCGWASNLGYATIDETENVHAVKQIVRHYAARLNWVVYVIYRATET